MEVTMPTTQLIYTPFHCIKLSRKVILTSIIFSPKSVEPSTDESGPGVVFDCADKKMCGVCTEWGRFRSYNWEICSHPELKKSVSE
jgi:hypothetical protein